jgi:hypothetical protein
VSLFFKNQIVAFKVKPTPGQIVINRSFLKMLITFKAMSREFNFEKEFGVIVIELNHLLSRRLSNASYMPSHSISMILVERLRLNFIPIKLDRVNPRIYLILLSIYMGSNLSEDFNLLVS